MNEHKFPYKWTLKDAVFTKDKGKVFSCFACGGGSTMGYKLAGFDVLGCNEIDPKMIEAYRINHNPKYSFLEPIQTFKLRNDLPRELYNLDILDGSPPCSSFSMAGNREKDWGKEKVFREGQAEQVLDTLFFDFIDLAKKLQPKIVIAENVKGLLLGNARKYVSKIYEQFEIAGYILNHFLLNAENMGIPQFRERVFFIAIREDLNKILPQHNYLFESKPIIDMNFNEEKIFFEKIKSNVNDRPLKGKLLDLWKQRRMHDRDFMDISVRIDGKKNYFSYNFIFDNESPNTITGSDCAVLFSEPRFRNTQELLLSGSWPDDYDFNGNKPEYLIGMSVPPVMTAQIATRIYEQWLSKL